MQISVKKLNGQEIRLEVSENDPISLVKNLVSEKLGIPAVQQRLVFKGKTLADSSHLHEYQIVDGSKIHLSIKKLGDGASSDTDNDFFGLLRNFLRSHFSAQDTERVMSKFKEDFKSWIWSLSLDDVERLASIHIKESSEISH
ncbi:unnamed protein product [Porites evermanni]|uniref:Ubiquitin-like domain-containing protein n=1 Tax=Porites evermanni TaxID=104178 RepID=A0ABN8RV23_9CNID|nr:unnamed protein product [Porites evermanni]